MSDYVLRRRPGEHDVWRGRGPLVGRLDLELTERCDNDCAHCCVCLPEGDDGARRRELSTAEVRAVLTEAAALGALGVRFTGGEPLLRDDFEELYLFARRLGLRVMLFTNGRRLTPGLADLLASVPPLDPVELSVYGMSERTYEGVSRRAGSYAECRRGAELLLARGVPFVVKGALLPGAAGEVAAFAEWAATLPAMDHPPRYATVFELRSRRDSEARDRVIRRMRVPAAELVRFWSRDREAYLAEMRDFCGRFMGPPGDRLFRCGAGHDPCVDAYGSVQACLSLRAPDTVVDLRAAGEGAHPGGALDAARLRHAVTEAFPRLHERRAADPEYLRRCARCFLNGLCEQCPAKSWAESGTLDTPVEYLCEVAHEQARDLGMLAPGERAWDVSDWEARVRRV